MPREARVTTAGRRLPWPPEWACVGRDAILSSRRMWCFALGMLGAGLALAGAGLLVSGRDGAMAFAANAIGGPGEAAASGMVLSSTPLGENRVLICLVDTARQRLAVYTADAKRNRLKLLAVRDLSADWTLTDYNNDPPLPKEIQTRVEKWKETSQPAADPESGKQPEGTP